MNLGSSKNSNIVKCYLPNLQNKNAGWLLKKATPIGNRDIGETPMKHTQFRTPD